MNPLKTPAIVIKTYPYSETSLTVSLFTAREGKINLIAKGATRPKNLFGSDLNTLRIGEFIYNKSKNAEIGSLIESHTIHYPVSTTKELTKFKAASYITDILRNFIFLPEENHIAFNIAKQALCLIEKEPVKNISLITLIFEIKTLMLSGIITDFT